MEDTKVRGKAIPRPILRRMSSSQQEGLGRAAKLRVEQRVLWKGSEKTAINMIKNGETNSKITLYTGLSDKHIEELRDRIKKENLQ